MSKDQNMICARLAAIATCFLGYYLMGGLSWIVIIIANLLLMYRDFSFLKTISKQQ